MSVPAPPVKRFEDGSGAPKPDESRRGFFYFTPKKRRPSTYMKNSMRVWPTER